MSDFLSRVEAILSGVMNFNPKSRVERLLMKWVGSVGNVEDLETEDKSSVVAAINEIAESGGGEVKPYTSLKRLGSYIYEVTFDKLPIFAGGDAPVNGACSSYVQGGKLYRNLDWAYSELASFHVICKGFEGMAFSPDLEDGQLSNSAISQLPYRLVDGCNDYGIRVSTHVLFNDWDWVGSGNTPLYKIPYLILSSVKSLDNLDEQLEDILADLYATESLVGSDYLLQFVVTDGVSTYAILPPESSSGSYVVQDISENPKLTNFRWVSDATVARVDLQDRPTGVERWNLMPCDLKDLRFTKAYESANRLSEFIGIDGTTKDSTDEELTDIYDEAHAIYLVRERDGQTWQTMHSVVYGENGLEHLWVQEDWDKDYICALKSDLGALVIDYSNPVATDYTNAIAAFGAGREVKLRKGDAQIPMTRYDANRCFFGGTVSAYLPGGYVIAVYAHIDSDGQNYFWYEYQSTIDGAQKPLVVAITQSGGLSNYAADKTNAEIYAAWQSGREVIASLNGGNGKIPCIQADLTSAYFSLLINDEFIESGTIAIVTSGGTQTVTMSMKALQPTTITDSAGYFTTDTVEGALAEIGAKLAAYPSDVWEGGSYGG